MNSQWYNRPTCAVYYDENEVPGISRSQVWDRCGISWDQEPISTPCPGPPWGPTWCSPHGFSFGSTGSWCWMLSNLVLCLEFQSENWTSLSKIGEMKSDFLPKSTSLTSSNATTPVLALRCFVLVTKRYHHLFARADHLHTAFVPPCRASLAWSNSSKLSAKSGSCLNAACFLRLSQLFQAPNFIFE